MSSNLVYKELSRLQCDQIEIRTALRQVRQDIQSLRDDFKSQFDLMNDAFMARLAKFDAVTSQRFAFIDKTTLAQTTLFHTFSNSIQMLQQTTSNILYAGAASKGQCESQASVEAVGHSVEAGQSTGDCNKVVDGVPSVLAHKCTCYKTEKSAPGCSFCDDTNNDIKHSYFE
jgi:hypothetical protein